MPRLSAPIRRIAANPPYHDVARGGSWLGVSRSPACGAAVGQIGSICRMVPGVVAHGGMGYEATIPLTGRAKAERSDPED
ncbi:hypothetical protein JIN77_07260 [Verrucomicrobiaceae bacterium R5-34]|uniref:Uncharacterized protein n=1 Tax=Oceaniferula flava TaxID=2800421 RepID=A0AAE2SB41_9BACT|nr:hypothetical protein [Oceaniferula flavus]MBK1830518.1 hypothetical protein [Verrucomicrobiaceae bacterium R5-34]MBK1854618.1 hypothetical protein [Oceaniferula flavus]MBM1135924.1 hypothetical protein [Oceaniferula flavus]